MNYSQLNIQQKQVIDIFFDKPIQSEFEFNYMLSKETDYHCKLLMRLLDLLD